nr:uncharacterized protein LOC129257486 [Lytechinus pictus]
MLGKILGNLLGKDTKNFYKNRKSFSVNDLLEYNPRQFLNQRPDELLIFLCELCNISVNSITDKQTYLLAKAVEQLYTIWNPQLVLPLSMRENIVMYSLTSSKLGANLMNHVSPAGSYRTLIIRCLDSSAEDSIAIPAGTSRCVFDNNQIIGKTYTIKGDNKVPTSVMCSAAYTCISLNEGDKQKNGELKPSKWMWNSPPEKEGSDLLVFSSDYDDFFRDTRDKLLKQQIQKVYDEHNQQSEDHIDKYVQEIKDAQTEKSVLSAEERTMSLTGFVELVKVVW